MSGYEELQNYIHKQPFLSSKPINIDTLKFDPKIKALCKENKCGQYGKNYMCPPYIEDSSTFKHRLGNYEKAIIIVLKKQIQDSNDHEEFYKHADVLHDKMLGIERKAKNCGYINALALIGGHCRLCQPCKAYHASPCPFPKKARTSMEAVGIHVIDSCKAIGLDINFRKDQVIWIGLLMI